jgi:hypothetical protein
VSVDLENATTLGTDGLVYTASSVVGREVLVAADELAARTALVAARTFHRNVLDYAGIDLTGATTSDAAFQGILDAAAADAAAGGGIVEVYVPPGTLSLTTRATVGAGVTLRGAGMGATTIRTSSTAGLELTGQSDIAVADLAVECTGPDAIGMICTYTGGVQKRVSITSCRITGTTNNAVRVPFAVDQFTFTGNTIENCDLGFSMYAPTTASGLISTGIVISHNKCRNVGSVNIQIYKSTDSEIATVFGVVISENDLRDFTQVGVNDLPPIPIEPNGGINGITIANNTIDGVADSGISTADCTNMTITGNVIRKQRNYAVELNGGKQITIASNVVEDCESLTHETGNTGVGGKIRLSDVVIANNVVVGTGRSSYFSGEFIRLKSARRVRITGNLFNDWKYLNSAIRIGFGSSDSVAEDVVVEGNTFVVSDANTAITAMAISSSLRTNVVGNTFRINRNLVSNDDLFGIVIAAEMNVLSSGTLIEGNHIQFAGTVTAAPNASGIGNDFAGAGPCAGLTVARNYVVNGPRGLLLRTNSTDLTVYGNDTTSCASGNIIPLGALGMPSVELGHAFDTTLTRLSAGKLAVEGVEVSLTGHTHVAGDVVGAVSWVAVPASATAPGTAGQMAYAAGFFYICVATNSWQRVALTAW